MARQRRRCSTTTSVPPKVEAAMDFMRFLDGSRRGSSGNPFSMAETPAEERSLSRLEQRVYDESLGVLFRYFTGECDYLDVTRDVIAVDDRPDDPGSPVPVQ